MFGPTYFGASYWGVVYWAPGTITTVVTGILDGDRLGQGGPTGRVYDFVARNRTMTTGRKKFRSKVRIIRR